MRGFIYSLLLVFLNLKTIIFHLGIVYNVHQKHEHGRIDRICFKIRRQRLVIVMKRKPFKHNFLEPQKINGAKTLHKLSHSAIPKVK